MRIPLKICMNVNLSPFVLKFLVLNNFLCSGPTIEKILNLWAKVFVNLCKVFYYWFIAHNDITTPNDANVHRFKCGWLSHQYRILISQTAILPVSRWCHAIDAVGVGEGNAICQSNSCKRTNYLSEIFLSLQI